MSKIIEKKKAMVSLTRFRLKQYLIIPRQKFDGAAKAAANFQITNKVPHYFKLQ